MALNITTCFIDLGSVACVKLRKQISAITIYLRPILKNDFLFISKQGLNFLNATDFVKYFKGYLGLRSLFLNCTLYSSCRVDNVATLENCVIENMWPRFNPTGIKRPSQGLISFN